MSREGTDPRQIGDYRLVRELGHGGMGTVYEAIQLSLGRRVALKVLSATTLLDDRQVERFQREAGATAKLKHPHIVPVFDSGQAGGIHYFAMQFIEGWGLDAVIRDLRELPLPNETLSSAAVMPAKPSSSALLRALSGGSRKSSSSRHYFEGAARLGRNAAGALSHAHMEGVIHRDVKPSNLLLDVEGKIWLTDFGLARSVGDDSTQGGDAAGTLRYMAPERLSGWSDAPADIYGLGITLYELLTLKPAFDDADEHVLIRKITEEEPQRPRWIDRRIPRDLESIVRKAMAKDPGLRYRTSAEMAEDLDRFLDGRPVKAASSTAIHGVKLLVKRHRAAAAVAGVALFLTMALVAVWAFTLNVQRLQEEEASLRAEHSTEIALEQSRLAVERREEVLRLSDIKNLQELAGWAEEVLWPALPEKVHAMEDWLAEAKVLAGRLEGHRNALDRLRREARIVQVDGRASWVFTRTEDQWQHDTQADLVSGLETFALQDRGVIHQIEVRLAFAMSVYQQTIEEPRAAWERAIASISDRAQCPMYDGLPLRPQLGLIPIGRDPNSHLWEFAHLETGKPPRRDERNKLVLQEGTGLVFVLLPGGKFRMGAMTPTGGEPAGSPNVDRDATRDEFPVHEVTLAPFFISKFEMTQGQWEHALGSNPSSDRTDPSYRLHPVSSMSWQVCTRMLARLGLEIPSEAQWEYAARGGTTTVWWTGDDPTSLVGAGNLVDQSLEGRARKSIATNEDGQVSPSGQTIPVGSLRPNQFGLHDVIGNIFELCRDRLGYYSVPTRPGDGERLVPEKSLQRKVRVKRGGCWYIPAARARSAARELQDETAGDAAVGVRPTRRIDE